MKLAPIILFCFKRIDTLTECVKNLKLCPESANSDLYIYSDAARNDQEYNQVYDVRNFIKNIDGFKSISIIERDVNMGVDYNIIYGIKDISTKFDSFIVVEDDLIVSSEFLTFLNEGLNYFHNKNEILTISAFNYIKIPFRYKWDCYFTGRSNPWGWATWSHKIKEVDWEVSDRKIFLNSKITQKQFNYWGSDLSRMLKNTLSGKIKAWDIRLDYFMFKNKKITVYPCKNMVINIGFKRSDASNTFGFNRYKNNIDSFSKLHFKFPDFITKNEIIIKSYINKNNLLNRIKTQFFKLINYKNI